MRELADEAHEWRRWKALLAEVDPDEEPAAEREAARLARCYQAGDDGALELLYRHLEVAIVAILLHQRALHVPPSLSPSTSSGQAPSTSLRLRSGRGSRQALEEAQRRSRTVLGELARSWRPGVSFLGYFFRTFPDAIAREAPFDKLRAGPEAGGRRPDITGLRRTIGHEKVTPLPNPPPQGGRGPDVPWWARDQGSLPELERQIVRLRALEGRPMKWVARQVGMPVGTAFKLYERARGRLEAGSQRPEGRSSIAMQRLVRALHLAAGADERLPNRDWAMAAAGLKRWEYDQLMGRLEGAGAVRGRRRRIPGYLVERDVAATLARVGFVRDKGLIREQNPPLPSPPPPGGRE